MRQFNPIKDVGVAGATMVNQAIGTGLNAVNQFNAGMAGMALSFFNAIPPPPLPPALGLPGSTMSIAPTGVAEEDFDVME